MATWLVSKCTTPGRREQYVRKIQEYLDLDVFGKCGLRKLPKSDSDDEKQLDVYRKLLRPYYFYFSFENMSTNSIRNFDGVLDIIDH